MLRRHWRLSPATGANRGATALSPWDVRVGQSTGCGRVRSLDLRTPARAITVLAFITATITSHQAAAGLNGSSCCGAGSVGLANQLTHAFTQPAHLKAPAY